MSSPQPGRGTDVDGEHGALIATIRLLALTTIGIRRIKYLLAAEPAQTVVEALVSGKLPTLPPSDDASPTATDSQRARWSDELRAQDVGRLVAAHLDNPHLSILDADHPLWPFALDPDPPILLFVAGDPDLLQAPHRVGVVGTRRCSAVGRRVARELGRTLAEHDVAVVSGLASGVDAEAHHGAGTAVAGRRRIGVVAGGLDVVYPPRNRSLWIDVQRRSVMISETPLGSPATRWRFPARNRLIAGLSSIVVVVESHEKGGALITVDEAARRGIEVAAVPGSVGAACAVGTNQLLVDGALPVRDGSDVLAHLGVRTRGAIPEPATAGHDRLTLFDTLPEPGRDGAYPAPTQAHDELSDIERRLLERVDGGPVHLDELAVLLGEPPPRILAAVGRLERAGTVTIDGATIDRSP